MLQTTTRIKLLLAYREQKFTAAVFTLQDPIGGQTRNLSCDGPTSRDDPASAPRFIAKLLCYWGLLERRPLWECVQLRIRTGHRQASNNASALPKRDRKAAHVPSRASIPESSLGYKPLFSTPLCRSMSLML
jgi:hypothetical protein